MAYVGSYPAWNLVHLRSLCPQGSGETVTKTAAILHAVLFVVAIVAYVVLTITGHDGNPVFLFFAGQVSGVLVQATSQAVQVASENASNNSGLTVAPKRSTIE